MRSTNDFSITSGMVVSAMLPKRGLHIRTVCLCGGYYIISVLHAMAKAANRTMKVLVACEFSGIVRDTFNRLGHNATPCDLLETETPGSHYRGNVYDLLDGEWDLMIAHPPCTHLAVSGARWFKGKQKEQAEALDFVRELMDCDIPRIALENPISVISSRIRKPDQIIQPWMFGHGETKATCLWLKNLPKLKPTNVVDGREQRVFLTPPSPDRWKIRSRTFEGIALAMAEQWGKACCTLDSFMAR